MYEQWKSTNETEWLQRRKEDMMYIHMQQSGNAIILPIFIYRCQLSLSLRTSVLIEHVEGVWM